MRKLLNQLYSFDILKGAVLTFALVLPIYLGIHYDQMGFGFAFALGVFYTFLPNTDGNYKHRIWGILLALILALIITFLSYASRSVLDWLFILFFAVCIFSVSMFSVYGQRASMVAFSGHFALIMSFALLKNNLDIKMQLILILGGGVWYFILAGLSHWFFRNRIAAKNLSESVELTADYLKIKYELLWNSPINTAELERKLIELQVTLNEKHELLRDLLYHKRRSEGQSNKTNRMVLIFLEMLDSYELAFAINADSTELKDSLGSHFDKLKSFKNLSSKTIVHLYALAEALSSGKELAIEPEDLSMQTSCEEAIQNYVKETGLPKARTGALLLRNLMDYEFRQWQKVSAAKRVFANIREADSTSSKAVDRNLFITTQDYSLRALIENLNFGSSVFKHALRLTVAMLLGLAAGRWFEHQNAYWILLTVAVILRPNFGLTKTRAVHRILGTLGGAAIGIAIIYLFDSSTVYGSLAIPSLLIGFVFVQKNYRIATTFITMAVILLYAILVDNALGIVHYRVIDTLIGAGISFFAIYFLWPSWEQRSINADIKKSLDSSADYLIEIDRIYHSKFASDTSYRLARKKAFIDNGNLMAAFQRLTEEPKSKRDHVAQIYAAVVLNQTFLSALAGLSTYIQNHETTPASYEYETIVKHILENLKIVGNLLEGNRMEFTEDVHELNQASEALERKYHDLEGVRNRELETGFVPLSDDLRNKLQEGKLITDHLKWLHGISDSMKQVATVI